MIVGHSEVVWFSVDTHPEMDAIHLLGRIEENNIVVIREITHVPDSGFYFGHKNIDDKLLAWAYMPKVKIYDG